MGNVFYSREEFIKLFSTILEDYGDCMFASDFSALLSALADYFESRHALICFDFFLAGLDESYIFFPDV